MKGDWKNLRSVDHVETNNEVIDEQHRAKEDELGRLDPNLILENNVVASKQTEDVM